MFEAFTTPEHRNRSLLLLVISGALAAAAAAVGIDDNPPGIVLAYLSTTVLVLAFVHHWRTWKRYRRLIYAACLAFVASAVLSNVLELIGSRLGEQSPIAVPFNVVGAFFFLVATLLCPPGLVVGIIGSIVAYRRERRAPSAGAA